MQKMGQKLPNYVGIMPLFSEKFFRKQWLLCSRRLPLWEVASFQLRHLCAAVQQCSRFAAGLLLRNFAAASRLDFLSPFNFVICNCVMGNMR